MKIQPANRTASVQEYYFSKKQKEIEDLNRSGIDVINLGIGSPDMAPSENTLDRLVEEARRPNVHGYQSYSGAIALRKAFALWYLKYFNVDLDPECEILPLIGSKEGIMHITMAFVNQGDEVLVPDPGYPTYSAVTNLLGGKVRTYDLKEEDGWLPDFNVLEDSDLSRIKLMWVNYPHMPSGTKGSLILFERLVRFATRHNILICNDNPYSFILNNEYQSILNVDGAKEVALEMNSLSKSHNMAGWRVGMVAGHREYVNTILKVKSNMDSGMFLPVQLAAIEALSNTSNWYKELNRVYSRRREIAGEILQILGCTFNSEQSGLFLWGRIPENSTDGEQLADNLLTKAHVFVTPGFIFGKNGERYIRISLCSNEEILLIAKERIIDFTLKPEAGSRKPEVRSRKSDQKIT
jgi:LL-diaminopimelate aminotransferase